MKQGFPRDPAFGCPYEGCGRGGARSLKSTVFGRCVRNGSYRRKNDARQVSRFRCLDCRRTFSSSRFSPCFGQKKRTLNPKVRELLISGMTQRGVARVLRINVKTVVRKFLFLANQAALERKLYLETLRQSGVRWDAFQFDEMESSERSKCLPLSIALVVLPASRKVVSFRVGSMPAKGILAAISRKKYGPRRDERRACADSLFSEVRSLFIPEVEISSDENPHYPPWITRHFPKSRHKRFKGKRGCVAGQGELKKTGFDPLFAFNHTAAMLRANISRLFRRTWNTTKRADRLAAHIELYIQHHNQVRT